MKCTSSKCRLPRNMFAKYCSTNGDDEWISSTNTTMKRLPTYGIYKPSNNEAVGAAMQIHFDVTKKACFFHAAKQMVIYFDQSTLSSLASLGKKKILTELQLHSLFLYSLDFLFLF